MNHKYKLGFVLALTAGVSGAGIAGEAIRPAGPIGGTDIRQALMPPPGVYVGVAGVGLGLDHLWNGDDRLQSDGASRMAGVGIAVVYDTQLFGGALGSTLATHYERTCFGLKGMKKACGEGLGDTYSDVLMWGKNLSAPSDTPNATPWIPYGLNVLVGLGVTFPTGKYSASERMNVGSNVYDFAPNVALTYITPSVFGKGMGDATEFSARMFYNVYTKNDDTHYKSGDILSLDFAISQRFGQWQAGLAGSTFTQLKDDRINGDDAPNNGNRAKALNLGPVVAYDFMWDGVPWSVSAKGLLTVMGENIAGGPGLAIRIGRKL